MNESSIRPVNELTEWARQLEGAVARHGVRCVDRVVVVSKTGSTQDLAESMAGERPGLMLLAGVQTNGRGRFGRRWVEQEGRGVTATFAIDGGRYLRPELSISVGLATCRTVEAALGAGGRLMACGLRWPNDVVERRADGSPGRKLAGVLIERREKLVLVGVGINVLQSEPDWPSELRAQAASLSQGGCPWSRLMVAERLLLELDRVLAMGPEEIVDAWKPRDLLRHQRTSWVAAGVRYDGLVTSISPTSHIELRLESGESVQLDAASASLQAVDGKPHKHL